MKGMTVRLPDHYRPRLAALAEREGLTPAEFARRKLIETIEQAERSRHRAAMEEMVRQAILHREIRDEKLEEASLQAIAKQEP
jgi:predicted DNA-binding protein